MFQQVTLLLGLMVLGTQVWSIRYEFIDISKNLNYFVMSVEFAVFQYNEDNKDEYAYKLLRVRQSQRKRFSWMFLMDLEMGRTICKKHEEDIENCPLQEGQGEKKVRCTFLVDAIPMVTKFTLLNSTCIDK
ncbi:PREDICTED: probable cystatin-16-like [Chrysochloris asiatica]|uniref:Probable cystatin-16-like n=1 Tax=Chrysochloris asiatica TaxID=185453 RepID=A0A9B0THI8_CHRAS|nr:PREDICTED: probable cystatin-16-like [Chrysochloris asiatica]